MGYVIYVKKIPGGLFSDPHENVGLEHNQHENVGLEHNHLEGI